MCKRRKGAEDKANAAYLCTLDESAEFWQVLPEVGSLFVHASLLTFFQFLTLSLEQQGVSKGLMEKIKIQGTRKLVSQKQENEVKGYK